MEGHDKIALQEQFADLEARGRVLYEGALLRPDVSRVLAESAASHFYLSTLTIRRALTMEVPQ